MTVENYGKMLLENITKSYRKTNSAIIDTIDEEAKNIACSLQLADRIERTATKDAFITLKDHKNNFRAKMQTYKPNQERNWSYQQKDN